ncbi:MAG: LysR family transcriptional regulator [Limisphaerales bacterium]
MDIRYLESLIAVAESGSIARAARAQGLTAAAVGQRIAIVEEHFGKTLLDRSARRATPTEACTRLLPRARQLVRDFHDLGSILEPGGLSGRFRLGAIPTALTGLLPEAVRQLAEIAPRLTLDIKPGTSESLFADLGDRKLDGVIVALPPFKLGRRFAVEILRIEPLLLLSRKTPRMTRRSKLEGNPYICFDSKSWSGAGAVRYLKDERINIEPFYELDALEPIEKLVLEGMGVSLMPRWSGLDLRKPELKFDVIKDQRYARKMALITQADSVRPQMVELLRKTLKTRA